MTNVAKRLLAAAAVLAAPQVARAENNPPLAGTVIFDLDGRALPKAFTTYTAAFVATGALTYLSFAFRDDPRFFSLDDVTVRLNGAGANLVTNGDFEAGPAGVGAPAGWTYLNLYGAAAAGRVQAGCGVGRSRCYYDGAVGSYDTITQAVATVAGQGYAVSFALMDNSSQAAASALAAGGRSGVNLMVYAGDAAPVAGGVPEAGTWAMMLAGFGATGAALRARRRAPRVRFA